MIERIKIERIPEVSAYKLSHAVSKLRFLKGADKAVLRAMCDRYPMCFPDVDDLAEKGGCSAQWARRALRDLEYKWKLIVNISPPERRRGGRGITSQYFIKDRAILDALALQEAWDRLDKENVESVLPRAGLTVKNPKRFMQKHATFFAESDRETRNCFEQNPQVFVPKPASGSAKPETTIAQTRKSLVDNSTGISSYAPNQQVLTNNIEPKSVNQPSQPTNGDGRRDGWVLTLLCNIFTVMDDKDRVCTATREEERAVSALITRHGPELVILCFLAFMHRVRGFEEVKAPLSLFVREFGYLLPSAQQRVDIFRACIPFGTVTSIAAGVVDDLKEDACFDDDEIPTELSEMAKVEREQLASSNCVAA